MAFRRRTARGPVSTAHPTRELQQRARSGRVQFYGWYPYALAKVVRLQPQSTTLADSIQPKFAMPSTTGFRIIRGMTKMKIGSRIKELRERLTNPLVSQSDLARLLDVTPQAVQKWEDNKSAPRRHRLDDLAAALRATTAEVVKGTEWEIVSEVAKVAQTIPEKPLLRNEKNVLRMQDNYDSLPLISWEQAYGWEKKMDRGIVDEIGRPIVCPFAHGPDAFVLRIEDESNFDPASPKSYAPGDFIYVDPGRSPENRSMVIVRMPGKGRALLKQYLTDGDRAILKTLNPDWPGRVMHFPVDAAIIGVVIGKLVPE